MAPSVNLPVLVFDGDCAFCTRSAEVAERWVRSGDGYAVAPWQHLDLAALGLTAAQCDAALTKEDMVKRSAQRKTVVVGVAGVLILLAESWGTQVWAQNTPLKVDTGDTAWVLVSSAFVLAMLMPGLFVLMQGG